MPSEQLKTFSGSYTDIRLDFTPEEPPPPGSRSVRFRDIVHYTLQLGHLHILLDGVDAARLVPSSWLYSVLVNLTGATPDLLRGGSVTTPWLTDPWQFDVRSDPEHDKAFLTLHLPGHNWVALRDVSVPLHRFCAELVEVTKGWLQYLNTIYYEEIAELERGQYYRNAERIVEEAELALQMDSSQ